MKKKTKTILLTIIFPILLFSACKKSSDAATEITGRIPIGINVLEINEFKLVCEEAQLVNFLNLHRKSQGLNELTVSISAVQSSRGESSDYSSLAENTSSLLTASEIFCQWKKSSTNNANMLNDQFKSMGIGNSSKWSVKFGAEVQDYIAEPLNIDSCTFASSLPKC